MMQRGRARRLMMLAPVVFFSACSLLPSIDSPKPTPEYNSLSGRVGSNGPVLVVKVDDTAPAHPQIGIEDADVVYVEQVEAGLTRLAVVFSSILPDRVGPVRSARISDIDIFGQYGRVAFAYSGAQSKMLPLIAAANWIDLGAQRQPPSIYTRDANRNAPVNMVLLPQALLDRAAERDQRPVNATSVGWTFGAMPEGGQRISSVEVRWPSTRYRIAWADKRFTLSQDGREERTESGEAFSPSTIVIQLVKISPSEFGDRYGGVTPKSETIGSGKALVLRNGRAFTVDWSRPSLTAPTTWTRADGSAMPFARGQVWVLIADQTRPPAVEQAPAPATK